MSTNEMRCSNCGTVNPPGQDKCVKCDMPLTASAEQALRTNIAAEEDTALLGGRNEVTVMGDGVPVQGVGDDLHTPGQPVVPQRSA